MPEWSITFNNQPALEALKESIESGPIIDDNGHHYLIEKTIDRLGALRIEVFADEHPPPHFRVSYNGEEANYRIDTGEQLNGGLTRYRRNVKRWHAANRDLLIAAWNQQRPSDCPVGEFRS